MARDDVTQADTCVAISTRIKPFAADVQVQWYRFMPQCSFFVLAQTGGGMYNARDC